VKYEVRTTTDVRVNAGDNPADRPGPMGLAEEAAEADAKARNAKAEALGITTRYVVAELKEAA
jgi:hypothetical protein